jgi:putative transposase
MNEFNQIDPIGSIYENSFIKSSKGQLGSLASKLKEKKKLVSFICYCLNTNHFHFLLEQIVDDGVEKFMHRLGTGYTKYFNIKNKRSGALFQGNFSAVHINTNNYLLHLSAYINLNNKIHKNNSLFKSSLEEYKGKSETFCKKDIIIDQFKNYKDYENFLDDSLEFLLENKEKSKELEQMLME